jgi:uncharacterized protein YdeI (YjbR/CyaY-like superfamily)
LQNLARFRFWGILSTVKPVFFATPSDFRKWLHASHAHEIELLVAFYKKSSGKTSITYAEALDEALCYGWIDGVRKNIAEDAYTIRFTPRKPKSQWSAVNIRHVKRLTQAGRMLASGLKAFEGAKKQPRKYAYEQRYEAKLDKAAEHEFRSNPAAWGYFQAQPRWYRHTATFWVVSAKKEETRQRRLAELIADCAASKPIKRLTRPVPKRNQERK